MIFKSLRYIAFIAITLSLFSCDTKSTSSTNSSAFTNPESGAILKSGESLNLNLSFADGLVDSVQYFVDTLKIKTSKDTSAIALGTKNYPLGSRLITAKIFRKGVEEDATTNIVIVSAIKPISYRYKIIKTYPHSTSSYTEGLEYHDGFLYESAGDYGHSSLRKTTLDGKILQQVNLDKQYFGEGITMVGDKIIQLTYKEKVGFVYDKNTFKLLKTFPYNHANEGWGLTFDGETIYNTDGSNRIFMLDKNSYLPKDFIEVYDDKGPVTQLNELEWIDGKLFANIYQSELIAIINPKSGAVEGYINMMGLPHGKVEDADNDVLNGIAYDKAGNRIFVTGKKWDKLFQIEPIKN
ncbi:glutaminyl-peptide cyclotransferase [Pedobacter sp. SD-b]|uniref:Glutaminyl-peptide cyclotransferase n=1 Tax=Pedobacter segetis TaxID=2793069 RepID=A0ABS1BH94_9SPHI|nr:glutaminyl-peptide cyclotransferase [Pedobacter segetis]MBK0382246.1 glutaminyl-peptide cyclotransferase [Pedobacter segetis]